jgi:voltage-gated potassium channel
VLREEVRRVSDWQDHHRRLVGRLLLILIATLVVDAVGTLLVFVAERHARGTDVHTLGDAFFFTTVQLLTVSSQMRNPLTPFGRAVDIVLEAWAVLVVAGSAGAFASFLQASD